MQILYYIAFGLVVLLGGWFVATSLLGHFYLRGAAQAPAKLALLVAAAVAAFMLYRAYELGEQQGRFGWGLGWVVLAFVVFELILLMASFMLGSKN
jgi:hypothetical protein